MARKQTKNENGNGYRFEIWGEHLFRQLGYHGVQRNVIYHVKSLLTRRRWTRQVDVQYNRLLDMSRLNLVSLVIVEFKYRPACVDDVVRLEETRGIVGADYAELALARRPSYAVQDKAERYGIRIYPPDELRRHNVFPGKTLCQQVMGIRLNEYENKATIVNKRALRL